MIKVENIEVSNFKGAFRGMRNPLESWGKGDDGGPKDLELALRLVHAGTDHSKFMRQIFFCADITAPMSWWWDFDTYKVATVKNSTSRMHKLGARELTVEDFSWDNNQRTLSLTPFRRMVLENLNQRLGEFRRTGDMDLWREVLMDLPQSYIFRATWTGNYQTLRDVYHARKNHKQWEFHEFCRIIEGLPHSELITTTMTR